MYFCETGGFAAVYSYGMIDRQLFMRRRRINILLRRGATLTEGIDRMKTYKTIMNGLTKVEEFVLCVITVVVTAITFINVLSRYVFHSNFAWSEELVINVFILMIMLGCALATRDGSMITLSLIFDNVGVGGKKILTVIDTVVNLIFYANLLSGLARMGVYHPAAHRLHLPGAPCDRVSGRRDEQQGRLCEAG